jgi:uncharacterized protein
MTAISAPGRSFRIEAIDVLRGFTLFGIILVHMVEQYYAGPAPKVITDATTATLGDHIAEGFSGIFIMGKFYMIFSFLFGLSFFIQLDKSDSENNFLLRFGWRLIVLFGIGYLHHLHYRGDILTIYAVLGFSLLIFYKLPDRYLLVLSLLLIFNVPSVVTRTVQLFVSEPSANVFDQDQAVLMKYYQTLKTGSYSEVLKANVYEFIGKIQFQVWSGRIYITLGLFLLGIYAGRKKVFENLNARIPFLKQLIRRSLWLLLACAVTGVVVFGGLYALKIQIPDQGNWLIGGFLYDAFNTALAVIYTAGILLLFQKEKWQKRLLVLYPVGRMGLTIYLMQTLLGSLLFFGYGMGFLYEIGSLAAFGFGILFFIFQIVFAHYWSRYFTYGPIEWIWRNLTYFKVQPLIRRKTSIA